MKPLSTDLPYPSMDGITCDLESARIVSPAYAGRASELTAILTYVYHSVIFGNKDMEEYAKTIEAIAISEMHHLDILANMLYKLGVDPIYATYPCRVNYNTCFLRYSKTPRKMLLDDIEGEMQAIRDYECMLEKLTNEDVAVVIQRIIMDEKLHVKVLKELFEKLNEKEC